MTRQVLQELLRRSADTAFGPRVTALPNQVRRMATMTTAQRLRPDLAMPMPGGAPFQVTASQQLNQFWRGAQSAVVASEQALQASTEHKQGSGLLVSSARALTKGFGFGLFGSRSASTDAVQAQRTGIQTSTDAPKPSSSDEQDNNAPSSSFNPNPGSGG